MYRREDEDSNVTMTITSPKQYQEFSWKGNWDAGADDFIEAFYSMLVGLTFPETGVLRAMKEFAEEKLSVLEPEEKEEEEDD